LSACHAAAAPADLRTTAHEYYQWRDAADPITTSDQGDHRYDSRLTDFRMSEVLNRREHIRDLLSKVGAMVPEGWSKDDRVDLILFQSQLAGADFFGRQLDPESSNPQIYVDACANAIFSLLKKEYAPPRTRGLAATARLEQMPAMLQTARTNLTKPVKLYASLAIDAARGGDDLYTVSLMTLTAGMSPAERKHLEAARDQALRALHGYADWLQGGLAAMPDWKPMGETQYNYLLKHVLLLPFDARDIAQLGEVELARYRALEAMLKDPSLASPDPKRAAHVPKNQAEFLASYESRLKELVAFIKANQLVTIPDYMGAFEIRELPAAFKPTAPGGFMNPPGLYARIRSGFISSLPTTRAAATSISARPSRIRDPSLPMRGFPVTSCRSRSPITSPTRSGASRETTSSRKAGRSMARKCSRAKGCTPKTQPDRRRSCGSPVIGQPTSGSTSTSIQDDGPVSRR
jgi:uncharacterized protein (DUF885 family)